MRIIKFIKAINPLKRIDSNTKIEYAIQKILAIVLIYMSAAIIMEGIIILLFTALGYNLMQGEMPSGVWVDFLPLYGFIGFGLTTILYVKKIEKRDLSAMMVFLNAKSLFQCIVNFIFGSALVGICILVLVATGHFEFVGFGEIDGMIIILGIIIGGLLFVLGDLDDAPGLSAIGLS